VFTVRPGGQGGGGGAGFGGRGGGGFVGRYRAAAGIAVVTLEQMSPPARAALRAPATMPKDPSAGPDTAVQPLVIQINAAAARILLGTALDSVTIGAAGRPVQGAVRFVETPAPGRNVVAVLPGGDARLRGEYVAIGAHNDHIGFTHTPADHDSLRAFNTARLRLTEALPPRSEEHTS